MESPVGPVGPVPELYGETPALINRRRVLAGAAAFAVAGRAAAQLGRPESRARALRWDGRARLSTGDQILDLSVQTRVEPFGRSVSRSWITRQGSWTARTMTVGPDGGWVERDGRRSPMPARQALHERQQFAIYGYMLDALSADREGPATFARPGLPPAKLSTAGGRLLDGRYEVARPDRDGTYVQELIFEGAQSPSGWPRRMTMINLDMRFVLDFDVFVMEPA